MSNGPRRRDDEIDDLVGAGAGGSAARFEASFRQRAEKYKANGFKHDAGKNERIDASLEAPTFNVGDLQGRPIPPRRWLVHEQIPMRNVTMLAGDGGLGKTLLAMQLATAVALGKPWLGIAVDEPGPVVCMLCEDELEELHRRQEDINRYYGVTYADLEGRLVWINRVGENNLLHDNGGSKWGELEETPLYHAIDVHARLNRAKLIVLDSRYNIYAGDDVQRWQIERFIGSLRRIAMAVDGAIVYTEHPSVDGMNSGRGYSGSTSWNAVVRSRLYLTASDDPTDEDARMLKTMKLNYGKKISYRLEWSDGVFVRRDADTGTVAQIKKTADRNQHDRAILDLVAEHAQRGRHLSKEPRSNERYLPTVAQYRLGGKKADHKQTMTRLLMDGAIKDDVINSHSKAKGLIVVAETSAETRGDRS